MKSKFRLALIKGVVERDVSDRGGVVIVLPRVFADSGPGCEDGPGVVDLTGFDCDDERDFAVWQLIQRVRARCKKSGDQGEVAFLFHGGAQPCVFIGCRERGQLFRRRGRRIG